MLSLRLAVSRVCGNELLDNITQASNNYRASSSSAAGRTELNNQPSTRFDIHQHHNDIAVSLQKKIHPYVRIHITPNIRNLK